ncbi:sterile alpha motif domain-containing protein 1-like [Erinaceus europaeus]|uniref:Sterile alpha motif domain-containing protein 1-like n=1 Tax=Erinaceus europaeus TaxID=9365 RepID=A0ABM3X7B6_ERIEU|nr:sterile alpha motif domain-containing protein 1-like [Erinaceus europaeus]
MRAPPRAPSAHGGARSPDPLPPSLARSLAPRPPRKIKVRRAPRAPMLRPRAPPPAPAAPPREHPGYLAAAAPSSPPRGSARVGLETSLLWYNFCRQRQRDRGKDRHHSTRENFLLDPEGAKLKPASCAKQDRYLPRYINKK